MAFKLTSLILLVWISLQVAHALVPIDARARGVNPRRKVVRDSASSAISEVIPTPSSSHVRSCSAKYRSGKPSMTVKESSEGMPPMPSVRATSSVRANPSAYGFSSALGHSCSAKYGASGKPSMSVKKSSAVIRPTPSAYGFSSAHGHSCSAKYGASGKPSMTAKQSSAVIRPTPSGYGFSSYHSHICSANHHYSGKPSMTVKQPGSSSIATASGSRVPGCKASYGHSPTTTLAPSTSSAVPTATCSASQSHNVDNNQMDSYCLCPHHSTTISFQLSHRQTCPPTLPASVLYTVTATSTPSTTQGPATVTINEWPYTAYGEDGAVTACGSSSISSVQGYPITKCAGSTSLIHSAISYSTSINLSPNGVLDYGNWSNFDSLDWDKENDTTRSSSLYSAFYSGLSTLCIDSPGSTVMPVTGTSVDVDKTTIATVTTSTTMHQCDMGAKATPNVERIRYTADDEDDWAELTVSVPFSHFDPGHINNWMNLTAFALVANAMQAKNTWEGHYMLTTGRGGGAVEHIVQHTGPSLVDLTYFSSINEGVLEQLQVQVHFKASESAFDCALMETSEIFIDAAVAFFGGEVAVADLLPAEMELNTLCDLANGD